MTDLLRLVTQAPRAKPWLLGAFALLVGGFVLAAIRHLDVDFRYQDVLDAIQGTSALSLALAVLAMAVSYFSLTGYDRSALAYVDAHLPYRTVAKTSFIAYALSNTIGLGVLTGGAVRMRLYGAAGLEAGTIAKAIAFNTGGFMVGLGVVGAAALLWGAPAVAPVARLSPELLRVFAALVLLAAAGFLVACARRPREGLGRRLPSLSLALQQLAISAVDIVASALVLWVLLPPNTIGLPAFLGFYAIALVLGIVSHLPGGIGVFEAVMLLALQDRMEPSAMAGALVLYRAIYYLLPLVLSLALLLVDEWRRGRTGPVGRAAAGLSPLLLAAFTLVVSATLLVSGVTPARDESLALLSMNVPLPLIEASHFLGSVAGLALLFVARGMLLRLDAAWWAGVVLAGLSFVFAWPKGIAVSEASLLAMLLIALALSRKQFTRRSSLMAQAFTGGWLISLGLILAALTGLLFFSYQDVAYAHQLWWQFAFDGDAPRSLRALMGVAVLALALAARAMFRQAAPTLKDPDAEALARADAIVRTQGNADACLALMGDKQFLFSESGRSFVMFGRRRRSWVALFDPIGPPSNPGELRELVWSFRELAHEAGGSASFYQVRPESLSLYLDAGMRVYKLGDAAHVELEKFSLTGRSRSNLRTAVNRAEREQTTLEVVPPEGVAALLPELRSISDAWLAEHETAEKRFSLGAFDEAYLVRNPVALVRREGQPIAFANLLRTGLREEVTVDLMRQTADAPPGTMDYLFVKLMLHYKAEGYARFSLGMAPLSGMAEHALAPVWHRLGRLLFAHGENFYNFRGLRAFKEKFDPTWEPRYLASSGVLPLFVLADIAALISGGLKGVVSK